jgi:mannose-6-phosphate isomerase-like protein (cupin superfamily)
MKFSKKLLIPALATITIANSQQLAAMQDPIEGMRDRVEVWKQFLNKPENHWQKLVDNHTPICSPCGTVYPLENFFQKQDESFAIVDMRNITFAKPHYHPGSDVEVYIVLQGTACVVVGYEEFQVKQGDAIIIPPNTTHFTIPDNEFLLAVINTPPYKPERNILVFQHDPSLSFDYEQFQRLTGNAKLQ